MNQSQRLREAGSRRAIHSGTVALFVLVAAALSYGNGQGDQSKKVLTAYLNTSTQHVEVNVPTSDPGVTIHLEQVEPSKLKNLPPLPDGFTAVASIQIFSTPKKTPEDEMVSFSPPLTVLLWKTARGKDLVSSFGLLAQSGWIVWEPNKPADTQISKFKDAGFDIVDFKPGNPAKVRVSGWPKGDPGCGH